MNILLNKCTQIVLVTLLIMVLVVPLNVVSAQDEAPPTTAEQPAPAAEEPAPAEEQPAPASEEPAPAEEQPAPAVEEPAPAEEQPAPAEEPVPAEEQPAPAVEEPATEDESEEETANPQEPPMPNPSTAEVVQQMADANAQLVDEQDQPIPLTTTEAAELLEENAGQISNVILPAAATVISQGNADQLDGGNDGVAQSFTSTVNGLLTQIDLGSNSTGSFTLNIYLGSPAGGTVLHTQSVVLTDTVNNTGGVVNSFTYNTLTLNSSLAVNQGQLYTFGIEGVMPAVAVDTVGGGSAYSNGDLYTLNTGSWSVSLNRDMAFQVHIEELPPQDSPPAQNANENPIDEKGLRAQFVRGPDDYKLVPAGVRIQGILSYMVEYGYMSFNLPAGIPTENMTILFWNGTGWSYLPDVIVAGNIIQGPAVGSGTYILVVR